MNLSFLTIAFLSSLFLISSLQADNDNIPLRSESSNAQSLQYVNSASAIPHQSLNDQSIHKHNGDIYEDDFDDHDDYDHDDQDNDDDDQHVYDDDQDHDDDDHDDHDDYDDDEDDSK